VLRTERIAHLGTEETAALRDFNPANVSCGSIASVRDVRVTSAHPRKRS
jgi:hypothetical protein